jgi:hypothetical protein
MLVCGFGYWYVLMALNVDFDIYYGACKCREEENVEEKESMVVFSRRGLKSG